MRLDTTPGYSKVYMKLHIKFGYGYDIEHGGDGGLLGRPVAAC